MLPQLAIDHFRGLAAAPARPPAPRSARRPSLGRCPVTTRYRPAGRRLRLTYARGERVRVCAHSDLSGPRPIPVCFPSPLHSGGDLLLAMAQPCISRELVAVVTRATAAPAKAWLFRNADLLHRATA